MTFNLANSLSWQTWYKVRLTLSAHTDNISETCYCRRGYVVVCIDIKHLRVSAGLELFRAPVVLYNVFTQAFQWWNLKQSIHRRQLRRAARADACRGAVFLALGQLRHPSIIRYRKHPDSVYLIHRSESRDFVFQSTGELKSPWAELIRGQWDGWKQSAEIALPRTCTKTYPFIRRERLCPGGSGERRYLGKLLTSGPKHCRGQTAHFFLKWLRQADRCAFQVKSLICSLVIKHLNTLKECLERAGLQIVSDFIRLSDSGCGNGGNQCRLWLSAANQNVTRVIDIISGVMREHWGFFK